MSLFATKNAKSQLAKLMTEGTQLSRLPKLKQLYSISDVGFRYWHSRMPSLICYSDVDSDRCFTPWRVTGGPCGAGWGIRWRCPDTSGATDHRGKAARSCATLDTALLVARSLATGSQLVFSLTLSLGHATGPSRPPPPRQKARDGLEQHRNKDRWIDRCFRRQLRVLFCPMSNIRSLYQDIALR